MPDLSAHPDAWLVEHAARGDDDAFGELVTRYQDRVFRLVLSILGQAFAADAEDTAQDVFVRVHHALHTFRGESAFGTWVYRVAFNHAVNVKARMRFRAPHVSDASLATCAADVTPADVRLDAHRRQAALRACVDELPDAYQAAVRLHYWLGVGTRDVAAMLDVPENTVKSYLHRARRLLRARLAQRGLDA